MRQLNFIKYKETSKSRKIKTNKNNKINRGDSMIKKYTYGKPFQTESVVVDIAAEIGRASCRERV